MKSVRAFSSGVSAKKNWKAAVAEASAQVLDGLKGECDLAIVFVTDYYDDLKPEEFSQALRGGLNCKYLLGCNTCGVIGGGKEHEMKPAVSILGMRLPGVKLVPFHHDPPMIKRLSGGQTLVGSLDIYPTENPKFLVLADPASCDIERWITLLNEGYGGAPVVGGLASAAVIGKPNWLILGDEVMSEGLVGLALCGPVGFETIVAQGCRPIGEPFIITKADGNILFELAGRPAFEALNAVVAALPEKDKKLARHSLFGGLVMEERGGTFEKGDFLIRNLMGYDPKSGALRVGATLRLGQTFQFQLRDAATSDADLTGLLESRKAEGGENSCGALLVSCCGRGKGLYGESDHDAGLVQKLAGPLPLAGFFAGGEIGPVGRQNFVHGYTSSIAIFS